MILSSIRDHLSVSQTMFAAFEWISIFAAVQNDATLTEIGRFSVELSKICPHQDPRRSRLFSAFEEMRLFKTMGYITGILTNSG